MFVGESMSFRRRDINIIVNFKTNETVNFINGFYSQVKADSIPIAQDEVLHTVHHLSENHGNA